MPKVNDDPFVSAGTEMVDVVHFGTLSQNYIVRMQRIMRAFYQKFSIPLKKNINFRAAFMLMQNKMVGRDVFFAIS